MLRFAVHLDFLFKEYPFIDRFKAAGEAGFKAVEIISPQASNLDIILRELTERNLKLPVIDLAPGNLEIGEKGFANDPGRIEEFKINVNETIDFAQKLNVACLNCLPGIRLADTSWEVQWETIVNNFSFAADILSKYGLKLLIEPMNTQDNPGYFIDSLELALQLIQEVGKDNVGLLYDVYHMQRIRGELTRGIRENINLIEHIHIANNPGRNEPGTGEINYSYIFDELEKAGYSGYITLEYKPGPNTMESLKWLKDFRKFC